MDCSAIVVGGHAKFDRCTLLGVTSFRYSQVSKSLLAQGSKFLATGTLDSGDMNVGGILALGGEGAECGGSVRLRDSIPGDLEVKSILPSPPLRIRSLDLERLQVARSLYLKRVSFEVLMGHLLNVKTIATWEDTTVETDASLRYAHATHLELFNATWPPRRKFVLDGRACVRRGATGP